MRFCAAVGAGLWAYGIAMDGLVRPADARHGVSDQERRDRSRVDRAVRLDAGCIVRFARHSAQTKTDAALVYFVLNAAAVALLNYWKHAPVLAMTGLLSWNTVVILVAAMIIPASPTRILVASLVAASTDPLAVWVAHLRGADVAVGGRHARAVHAELRVRGRRRAALSRAATNRPKAAAGPGHGQLSPRWNCSDAAAWARSGAPAIACWRAGAAIKLVRPELMGAATEQDAENMMRRFRREAQATAALNSPHTIRLFDFGVTDERIFYYVMELLSGQDLRHARTRLRAAARRARDLPAPPGLPLAG